MLAPQGEVASADSADSAKESSQTSALAEQVAAAVAVIESVEGIDPEKKTEYLDYLSKASKWLENTQECSAKAAQFESEAQEAPDLLPQAKLALEEALPEPIPQPATDATLAQLEQSLNESEEALKTAEEELAEKDKTADAKARADRKAEIAEQLEAAKTKLEESEDETKALSAEPSDAPAPVRRYELEARRQSLKSQIEMLEAERRRLESLAELFPIQRDLAQRQAAWSKKMAEAWRELVTDHRKAESERQAAEARRIASEAHPALRDLAEYNAVLAESRTKLAADLERASGYLEEAKKSLAETKEQFESDKSKVEVAGMTPTIGLLLRNHRDRFPSTAGHRAQIKFSRTEMQKSQVRQFELESDRDQLGDLDMKIEEAIKALGQVSHEFEPGYLENMVRDLLRDRREYLDGLLTDYQSYLDDLNALDMTTRDLLAIVDEYAQYIDERVLWIRSCRPLATSDLRDSWQALQSFADGGRWGEVYVSTERNVTQHPLLSGGLVLVCVMLIVFRRRIVVWLEAIGERVGKEYAPTFLSTLQALVLTLMLAAVWPIAFVAVGWWLTLSDGAPDLAVGLARGLNAIATVFFGAELFRQVCRKNGLAEKHFHWQIVWIQAVHSNLNRLMLLGLPALFLVAVFESHDGGAWKDSLGRIAFLIGLGVVALFLHDLLHPRKGSLPAGMARMSARWPLRFRHVWYLAGVGFPVTLGVLVGLGYSYSADQLALRFQQMIGLVLVLTLAQAVLLRALTVAWYRVAKMRKTLELRATEVSEDSSDEMPPDPEPEAPADEVVNLQLRQLVRGAAVLAFAAGFWFVWASMFPAFQVLDKVEFWQTTQMVMQETTNPDGTVGTTQVPEQVPVTLADMLLVLIVIGATTTMTRTLPGLLEIVILGRLPIDNGARHAILIISRYTVTLVGMIVACRMLGMTWASVQWLAAAMTVGLGFGMQEIFANLVSGLILLFERPIRIGDFVTVGGQTGKISRMQIRATTLVDFDRRELIVPNKRFITDDVINWTLSDSISRFVIPVGISYDSDPAEAHRLLLQVAKSQPLVLDEPEPSAVFTAFGDSTLNLELRAFIATRDHYATALHEVNIAIEKTFREAKIEIAFPQQDINIRGIDALLNLGKEPQQSSEQRKAA